MVVGWMSDGQLVTHEQQVLMAQRVETHVRRVEGWGRRGVYSDGILASSVVQEDLAPRVGEFGFFNHDGELLLVVHVECTMGPDLNSDLSFSFRRKRLFGRDSVYFNVCIA